MNPREGTENQCMVAKEFVNWLNYLIVQVDSVLKHARACLYSLCMSSTWRLYAYKTCLSFGCI